MRRLIKAVGLGAVGAVSLGIVAAGPALADYGPGTGDAVAVGSDTVQNIGNFLADGDYNGASGFNTAGSKNKLVNFNATPDENDRAGYLNGSTSGALLPLNPTIILRGGTSPILRPNGSGSGIDALNADTTLAEKTGVAPEINFARASSLPSSGEEQTAINNGSGGLHVIQISTDALIVATAMTTNAPASLTPVQLGHIYQCDTGYTTWNGANLGNGTGSASTIIPLVPQSGSGTRKTFLNDLGVALGLGKDTSGNQIQPTLGNCVQTVEENDPTAITGAKTPAGAADSADAIAPFSNSRINLYNDSYFQTPGTAFPGPVDSSGNPVYQSPGIKPLTGSSLTTSNKSSSTGTYSDIRGLYYIFRQGDLVKPTSGNYMASSIANTPFEPGDTRNIIQSILVPSTTTVNGKSTTIQPFVQTSSGQNDIADAGSTYGYNDLGVNP